MSRGGRGLPSSSMERSSDSSAVRRRSSSWALLPETGLPSARRMVLSSETVNELGLRRNFAAAAEG